MCGRFAVIASPETLAAVFELQGVLPVSSNFRITPRYNIAPGQPVLAVRIEPAGPAAGRRMPVLLQWGLVPSWAKDPSIGSRMINARAESAAEKPAFRAAWRRRRCLLPADAYYEWRKAAKGMAKQPFAFGLRDGGPMGLAGLWERWEGADGSLLETCSILTTSPNALAARVHDRMPLIVRPRDFALWLDPAPDRPERLGALAQPYPEQEMRAWPVANGVNRPANDDPRCLEPVGEGQGDGRDGPEQGELF